ncbi:hypothetical protein U2F10_11280 [Leptothoe sp. EHU-05/26/07-4]
MFNCSYAWTGLGRIYNIWHGSEHEPFFSVGQVFSESSEKYKITECNFLENAPQKITIKGEFEDSTFVSLSPKANLIISHDGNMIRVWDISSKDELSKFNRTSKVVHSSFVSDDGSRLFASFNDGLTYVWSLDEYELAYAFKGLLSIHKRCFILSLEQRVIIFIDQEFRNVIKILDYATGQEINRIDLSDYSLDYVMSLSIIERHNLLVIGSPNGTVAIFDMATNQRIESIQTGEAIETVKLSENGNLLILGNRYGNIRVLNLSNDENFSLISAHGRSRVEAISILDEQRFVSAGWDGRLKLWTRQ